MRFDKNLSKNDFLLSFSPQRGSRYDLPGSAVFQTAAPASFGGAMNTVLSHYHRQMFEVLVPRDPASHASRVQLLKKQGVLLPSAAPAGTSPSVAKRLTLAIRAHAEFTGSANIPDLERMPPKKIYALWIQMGNQAMRHSHDKLVADIRHLQSLFRFHFLREIEES